MIEDLVRRQRVGIELSGAKFGRGGLANDGMRYALAIAIDVAGLGIDL